MKTQSIDVEEVGTGYKDGRLRLSFFSVPAYIAAMGPDDQEVKHHDAFMSLEMAEDLVMFLQHAIAKAKESN